WDVLVREAKEGLRAVPGRGIGYGALRYLTDAFEEFVSPRVSFNYLGHFDGTAYGSDSEGPLLRDAGFLQDGDTSPLDGPAYALDVVARVVGGRLVVEFGSVPGVFS
ncbi:hypothetical protein, partial [Streptomyces sp. 130]|uniref:hypothetical protein n=1 Tax=Streptomyces sp. 130 TaxID=2591006 RepID=UPI00163DABA6